MIELSVKGLKSVELERSSNPRAVSCSNPREITPWVGFQSFPPLRKISTTFEVRFTKSEATSDAYENRTKLPKSAGLETKGPRERISGFSQRGIVRRFSREAGGYWAPMRVRKSAENVGLGRAGGASGIRNHGTVSFLDEGFTNIKHRAA
jgi:hypothetical protein